MIKALALATLLVASPVLAQAHEVKVGDLTLKHPHVRASMGMSPTTAGYLVIENDSKSGERLVSATCTCAKMVMIHKTEIKNGMASMKALDGLDIPAGGRAELAPGGTHLMVMGLKAPIKSGTMVNMTLTFAKAGRVTVPFMVMDKPGADKGAMPSMEHHQH